MDLRTVILARMADLDMTQYRLSEDQNAVHPSSAREYLRGRRETTGRVVGELLELAGLTVVPADLLGPEARAWLERHELCSDQNES